ncbi:hypothetical protein CEXT_334761 [Caerostris extrusa]|uniref:Uncharacterized protein n=1 Tax=Caerostris extrusa TaxID=172846 RepID=A0AAV4PU63_CAEEX|nr:hypothetical protein CEXT_334761 [Caerostris extrusa]
MWVINSTKTPRNCGHEMLFNMMIRSTIAIPNISDNSRSGNNIEEAVLAPRFFYLALFYLRCCPTPISNPSSPGATLYPEKYHFESHSSSIPGAWPGI